MVSVLSSLMWGANHWSSWGRERLLQDFCFQSHSTVVLRQKNQLLTGYRTTEMTGNSGITRKCSRTRLVWSSGERGKPLPKKDWEEGGGSHVTSLAKTLHPLLHEHQLLIAVHCYWAEQKQKKSDSLKCECTYFLTNQAGHLAANMFCSFSLAIWILTHPQSPSLPSAAPLCLPRISPSNCFNIRNLT